MSKYFGDDVFKLGFGLMRLPKNQYKNIDIKQVCQMVDKFIEAGGTYFDTAYVYDGGKSEEATKVALVDRYPRDKYTIATKLNARIATDEQNAKSQFNISLSRLGLSYVDYYLLHAIDRNNYQKYDNFHLWEYVKELKEKGLVRYYGFSFHGDPDLLDELLTKHPDVDFIQLQINYADWENPGVASRRCYEIARRHNVSITVMEPVKGGFLANPTDKVKEIFLKANKEMSFASWAIRYVASLDGIITVLSGMSNNEQMDDNLSYMKSFKPLDKQERLVIKEVQEQLEKEKTIKCTACHYCTEGCPSNIAIPEIFAVKNGEYKRKSWDNGRQAYAIATFNKGKASSCIECGQCEASCPQHLNIIELLKQCVDME